MEYIIEVYAEHLAGNIGQPPSEHPSFIYEIEQDGELVEAVELHTKLTHSIKNNILRSVNNRTWSEDECPDHKWTYKVYPENKSDPEIPNPKCFLLCEMNKRFGASAKMEGATDTPKKFLVSMYVTGNILKFVTRSCANIEGEMKIDSSWDPDINAIIPFGKVKELLKSTRTNCGASIDQKWKLLH